MRHKAILLGSVSVAAMASAVAAVQAQDSSVPDGFKLSVEGGALFGPNTLAEDKLGSGIGFPGSGGSFSVDNNSNTGWRAAIAVQKQIDPLWDMKLALALNHQFETTSSTSFMFSDISGSGDGSSTSGLFETKNDFDYETVDLEVGYTPEMDGPVNVRLFGGIRGIHYNDSLDKLGTVVSTDYSGGSAVSGGGTVELALDQNSTFFGAGPRLGAEASTRFGDSMFGVSGLVSAALMYGLAEHNTKVSYTSSSGMSGGPIGLPLGTISTEEWGWVSDFEASLGLDMYISDTAKLTIGARVENIGTMSNFSTSLSGSSGGNSGRLNFGPTIKFEAQF